MLWIGGDRATAILALEIGAVFGALAAIIRMTGSVDPPHDIRMEFPRKREPIVAAVVAVTLVGVALYSILFASALGMIAFPALGAVLKPVLAVPTGYDLGASPLAFTCVAAVIPLVLLARCGVKLSSIGLRMPTGRAAGVTYGLLLFPALAFVSAVTLGHKTPGAAAIIFLANFLNNGVPEEVSMRGILLSYARRYLSSPWAIFISCIAFSLLHAAVSVPEERGNPALVLANVLAENLPIALAFCWMTLRTRSVVPAIIVHFTLDALRHAF